MSSGPAKRVSPKDIQLVQNLIGRCLQLYMNRREVVDTLLNQAKIEPGFTELVWQKLEEENREFFKAYYLRLMVKNQIMQFNQLLDQQLQLMHQINSSIPSTLNRPHITPLHQNPECYIPEDMVPAMKSLHHTVDSSLQNAFCNGGSLLHPNLQKAVDMSVHASKINVAPNMIPTPRSNTSLIQGLNRGMMKLEVDYSGASQYVLNAGSSVLEAHPIVDTTVSSFKRLESNSQSFHEPLLESDIPPLGQLGQFPQTLCFSDLAADFTRSSDMLEGYPRSPFLGTQNDNFLDSQERENQGDTKRLDTFSEGTG